MSVIRIEKMNESTLIVTSDDLGIEYEIEAYFTFDVPGAKFMPSYKAKVWDGKARLYNVHKKTLPYGLLEYLYKFAENNGYNIAFLDPQVEEKPSLEQVQAFVDSLNLHTGGRKISLRDYQVDAIHKALWRGRMLALSPTSSGKSAIIYCYMRWLLERNQNVILMVPTTSLVTQMLSDFKDYASETDWDADEHVHTLYAGQDKDFSKQVLITTWQSVHSMAKSKAKTREIADFFRKWNVYIGDEAHRFASNSLLEISNKLVNAKYRLGTTGTIQDAKVSKLTLEGSFGPVYQVTTTRELMDAGQVVDLRIKCLLLDYDAETKQLLKTADYQKEIDYIVQNEKRNKFIVNLARASKGNTLVLFNYKAKQGKPMLDIAKDLCGDRPVFYIAGEVSVEERERIRKVLDSHTDAIVFATYATLSTGVNIPSLENIIFASPGKGKIRNLQSIGRGLRLKEGKSFCTLFDLADSFMLKSKPNTTLQHFKERLEQYDAEKFEYTIKTIKF